jgi:hypothetical protein
MGFRPRNPSPPEASCACLPFPKLSAALEQGRPHRVDVSSSVLRFLTQQVRRHRRAIGSRWRQLSAGRQALLTLAHLRVGHTYAQLAAGFGVGTTTAYRYATEAIDLQAALAPTLADAVRTASTKAYLLLDGTLLPIDWGRLPAEDWGTSPRTGRTAPANT